MNYKKYIQSSAWRIKRLEFLASKFHKNECFICRNKPKSFDIHHKTYKRLGDEKMEDLVALCRSCHSAVHNDDLGCKNKMNHNTLNNRVFKLRKLFK